jgi:tetratricopeptide (TPR) repeat protein
MKCSVSKAAMLVAAFMVSIPLSVSACYYLGQRHMSRATSYDWYNLANSYANAQAYREAISAYSRSLNMNSSDGDAWNNRGTAEEAVGQVPAALSDYHQAYHLGDSEGGANYTRLRQLASMHAASGNPGHCAPNLRWSSDGGAASGPPVYCRGDGVN